MYVYCDLFYCCTFWYLRPEEGGKIALKRVGSKYKTVGISYRNANLLVLRVLFTSSECTD